MRAGFVVVAGRPNVGKSTLFNRLLGGPKIAIVSRRNQTTRFCIRGIVNLPEAQLTLVDTPGWQQACGGALNASLRRRAERALPAADAGMLVLAGSRAKPEDEHIVKLAPARLPMIAVLNKTDLVRPRENLLPMIARVARWRSFDAIMPISAKTGEGIEDLKLVLANLMPESPALFPPAMVTDQDERLIIAEFIREKLFRLLGAELPYAVAVDLRLYDPTARSARIAADILVDKPSRQAIVIGAAGRMIKRIGCSARREIERFLKRRVHLELRVVVRPGWSDKQGQLARLGLLERS